MRVAFISRSSLFDDPGGDTIQMQQTAAELSSFGVEVDIIENGKTYKQSDFDLLHFFNLIRPGEIMPHLPSKVPYVISPIYVDYSMSDIYARDGFNAKIAQNLDKNRVEYLKALMRFLKGSDKQISKKYFLIGHKNSMLKVLREANHLLPNSKSEEQRISTDLNQKVPTTIIPNGSTSIFSMDRKTPRKPGSILCVARIEPRKNQKNLILAVNDLPNLKLTLIGRPGNNSQDYYDECKRISGTNVEFIEGGLDQSELIDYYRSSSVHVLPSWFETTGLSSLEAGACGCNLVISKFGDSSDYFKDFTEYCDPGSVDSIKFAILNAFQRPFDETLSNFILKNYTWQEAAKKTLKVYEGILA